MARQGVTIICAAMATILSGCIRQSRLDYALDSAGSNRTELETVLDYYRSAD
jgi:uncharacterized protein YsxB (DUF464 family)